ncbi:MAG: InlB B-repeat-containing protein, partial [Thermoanaerobaculia bacterium]
MDLRRIFSLSLLVLGLAVPAAVAAQTPKTLTVTIAPGGGGTVVSAPAGINCPGDCTESYAHGTDVTLTPTADVGKIFTGWSGDCTGTGACTVKLNQNRAVTAAFQTAFTLSVNKAGTGSGTVTSSPAGINCGVDCGEPYATGTVVTLTATPATGSTFTGWSGDCTGTGTCVVTMTAAHSVTATFTIQTFTLSASLAGTGSGTVTSAPAGINCGVDCSEVYDYNTVVALTATPAVGSVFDGWSGDCTGTGACNVTMDQARSVTATFSVANFELSVSLAGAGSGSVMSSPTGIDCGSDCSESYPYNTVVTLTATPAVGSVFDGWSGDCTGTGTCNVTMDQARSVTATFSVATFELTVSLAGPGSGSVASSPAGIDCGSDCSETYPYNTEVTLTATPAVGSVFGGWGGDCTGTGTCTVTLDQARSVTATFEVGTFVLSVAKDGDGAGTVTSSPAGINCGVDCSESYDYNTVVTLTATPYPVLSAFTGWSGDCTGTGACNVTLDQARSVTATFDDLGLDFFTVTPCRVIDTRLGAPLSSGVPLIIDVAGACGIPAMAK